MEIPKHLQDPDKYLEENLLDIKKFIEVNKGRVENIPNGVKFVAAKHHVTFPLGMIKNIKTYLNKEAYRLNSRGFNYSIL